MEIIQEFQADHYQHFRNIIMGKVENGLETENRVRGGEPIWKLLQQFKGMIVQVWTKGCSFVALRSFLWGVMQSSKGQQEEIRKPSSAINAKK